MEEDPSQFYTGLVADIYDTFNFGRAYIALAQRH